MSRAPGVLDTMRRHWHPSQQDLQMLLGANPAAAVHKSHSPMPSPQLQQRELPPQQRYQYSYQYEPQSQLMQLEQDNKPLPIIHGRETLGDRPTCAVMAASDLRLAETSHPSPSIGEVRTIRMKHLHEGSKLGLAIDSLQVTAVLSPMASNAGWRVDDYIVAVNGIMVYNQEQFKEALGIAIRDHAATGAPLVFQVSKTDHSRRRQKEDPCCGWADADEPRLAPMTVGQVLASQSYQNTEAIYGGYLYPGLDSQYIHPDHRSPYIDSDLVDFNPRFYNQHVSKRKKNSCLC
eukprot:CAMPEP_0206470854 /NCGR_PEP_ID=MMETSP0324_2-20121206/31193_1 /ASSEMBLY_ACC=CAM_ASM_000836 /TAXON_ID=2866 /ORGANISM="Crypthecodinium cohnii, Strain Seligo" /LENGTH=290 /DNA_ID=CAMNT_0053945023 /DNA_START=77 /DNA_END=949 /DNA_ORIENTATION=+